ncbi:unnamed protein product, partial [Amoebophrya sp. A120]
HTKSPFLEPYTVRVELKELFCRRFQFNKMRHVEAEQFLLQLREGRMSTLKMTEELCYILQCEEFPELKGRLGRTAIYFSEDPAHDYYEEEYVTVALDSSEIRSESE